MKKYIIVALLANLLIASDDKNVNAVDTIHENVVNELNNNVEKLPDVIQSYAKNAVNTVKQDGKNVNFFVGYSFLYNTLMDMGTINGKQHLFDGSGKITQLGTIGLNLFPNSWKIDLTYSGLLKEDWEDPEAQNITYLRGKEKEVNEEYFNFYMKPITTHYGSLGIGYFKNSTNQLIMGYTTTPDSSNIGIPKLVDVKNDGKNADSSIKSLELNNNEFYQYATNIDRVYLTYTLPNITYVPNGIGVYYSVEKSNNAIVIDVDQLVLHPDITSTSFGYGIFNATSDLTNGFNIKQLSIKNTKYDFKYYHYDEEKNKEGSGSKTTITGELVYQYTFNKAKNKRLLISILDEHTDWDGKNNQEDIKFSVGLYF